MGYDSENIQESEKAAAALSLLYNREEGSYPKEIAEELDTHPNTVSDMLKVMRELGLVQRGKRTKAQYYNVENKNLIDFFWKNLDEKLRAARSKHEELSGQTIEETMEEAEEEPEIDTDSSEEVQWSIGLTDDLDFRNEETDRLLERYFVSYLEPPLNEDYTQIDFTISEMMFDDFGLGYYNVGEEEFESLSIPVKKLLMLSGMLYTNLIGKNPFHVSYAVTDYLEGKTHEWETD